MKITAGLLTLLLLGAETAQAQVLEDVFHSPPGVQVEHGRLQFNTLNRPVAVKARVEGFGRPVELWFYEGLWNGKPISSARLMTPMTITPLSYLKGNGPDTRYTVYLEGGIDSVSGAATYFMPFSQMPSPGATVYAFLYPLFPDSIREPRVLPPMDTEQKTEASRAKYDSPPPPRPQASSEWIRPPTIALEDRESPGVLVVLVGEGFRVSGGNVLSEPLGRDPILRKMDPSEFEGVVRAMADSISLDRLAGKGCWYELTVLSADACPPPATQMKVFGFNAWQAQEVRASVAWSRCSSGTETTFYNTIKLEDGFQDAKVDLLWGLHLTALNPGDRKLVCLQQDGGRMWAIGGENGVLPIKQGDAVPRWSVDSEGRFVRSLVPLAEMKATLARRR